MSTHTSAPFQQASVVFAASFVLDRLVADGHALEAAALQLGNETAADERVSLRHSTLTQRPRLVSFASMQVPTGTSSCLC
jgi:hypothetical protein